MQEFVVMNAPERLLNTGKEKFKIGAILPLFHILQFFPTYSLSYLDYSEHFLLSDTFHLRLLFILTVFEILAAK